MSEQRNLFIAVILSMAVLFGFQLFVDKPVEPNPQLTSAKSPLPSTMNNPLEDSNSPKPQVILTRTEAIRQSPRISIESGNIRGSINLQGGQLDDLELLNFKETPSSGSNPVVLLSPLSSQNPYVVKTAWKELPEASSSDWKVKGDNPSPTLRPGTPVTLTSGRNGLIFERTFMIDEYFLITVIDKVINNTGENITLTPQSAVTRKAPSQEADTYVLHEGAVGVMNHRLKELKYKEIKENKVIEQTTQGGWFGFTDKYWLVALVPNQSQEVKTRYALVDNLNELYTCTQESAPIVIKSGERFENTQHIFAGAKVLRLLDDYETKLGFDRFDLAVDFGWFYFITKPLFYVLETFNLWLGNMGLAILFLTIFSKIILYPFSKKSFKSMAKMRELAPKIEKLRLQYGEDKMRLNQEMMELYKREGANPMSGCLPQLIQAPIFFCLYKVFYVTIEMRHAPFLGWIQDLSMPDPTTLFNLFGLIPWDPPAMLHLGIWPLLMGATMIIQQRMGPQAADPAQAKMMMIMPLVFIFLFSGFPAGVVLYWTFSNVVSIAQQWYFTRYGKVEPAVTKKGKR